jgi:hypothetical protein
MTMSDKITRAMASQKIHHIKTRPYLVAIHNKINTSVKVITVMWTDKGGLKIIGFNKI